MTLGKFLFIDSEIFRLLILTQHLPLWVTHRGNTCKKKFILQARYAHIDIPNNGKCINKQTDRQTKKLTSRRTSYLLGTRYEEIRDKENLFLLTVCQSANGFAKKNYSQTWTNHLHGTFFLSQFSSMLLNSHLQ